MIDLDSDYRSIEFSDAASIGIDVTGSPDNLLMVHRSIDRYPLPLGIQANGVGNAIVLRAGCRVSGMMLLLGNSSLVDLGGGAAVQNLVVAVYSGDTFRWGTDCVSYGVRVWVHGGRTCTVGHGCLFSEGIHIRTSDHHSIIDLASRESINPPADVVIEDHVWVGERCTINKGVTIGQGAILASGVIVSRDVPRKQLWGGVPAKMLRSNVSWLDAMPCTDAEIDQMIAALRD